MLLTWKHPQRNGKRMLFQGQNLASFFLLQFPPIQSLPGLTYSPHNSTLPGPSWQQGKGGAWPSGTGIRTERPEPRAIALCLSTVGHGGQWGFPHTFSPALLLWFPFPSKSETPLGGSKLLPVGWHPRCMVMEGLRLDQGRPARSALKSHRPEPTHTWL